MSRVSNSLTNDPGTVRDAATGTSEKKDKSGLTTPPEFKAETRQLLDIGTNSLYTNNKVFLRELLSNTSDTLEELRYIQVANHQGADGSSTAVDLDISFDIHVETNDVNGTLSI
jgi:HSP90 family molecular chaperone